jgi:hypothetical protein
MPDYEIRPAGQLGSQKLTNGTLFAAAEEAGFDGSITVDKGFATQQNMAGRKISVLLLDAPSTLLKTLVPLVPALTVAMDHLEPGTFIYVRAEGEPQ